MFTVQIMTNLGAGRHVAKARTSVCGLTPVSSPSGLCFSILFFVPGSVCDSAKLAKISRHGVREVRGIPWNATRSVFHSATPPRVSWNGKELPLPAETTRLPANPPDDPDGSSPFLSLAVVILKVGPGIGKRRPSCPGPAADQPGGGAQASSLATQACGSARGGRSSRRCTRPANRNSPPTSSVGEITGAPLQGRQLQAVTGRTYQKDCAGNCHPSLYEPWLYNTSWRSTADALADLC